MDSKFERYARQIRFAPFGEEGQKRLSESRVLICGCGALGSVLANTLTRAGVGHIRIVDRDFLELNNLQRQVVFTEADVASQLPKAIAATNRLREINSEIEIEPIVADVDFSNIQQLAADVDLMLDGTDNFDTRFLLNDASHKFSIPWVYGGCIGAEGQSMTIIPGETPCLRCLMPDTPPPGTTPTCDTAGIIGPIINVIASIEAAEAIKILSGNSESINRTLTVIDLWDNRMRSINLDSLKEANTCDACAGRDFPWLDGKRGSHSSVLCGRNSVQLSFPDHSVVVLDELADRLKSVGDVTVNPFLLRCTIGDYIITVFTDGRTIIGGTDDVATAKTVYAKYIGN
ncbi:MAG: ThiF family adenylyltransferase [Planctomycetales bacterium]|nr:ThiF family adenylyltransferase [Planctomycetales bacterium]